MDKTLHEYLSHVKGNFSIIAVTEVTSWQLSNYTAMHQIRNSGQKRGGIVLHVHNTLN